MKQLPSIAEAFRAQAELASILEVELRALFESAEPTWFFSIRTKRDESFALKTESGRVAELDSLEDFVACMLVVPLVSDIPKAVLFVERFFEMSYRRPPSDSETAKRSSDFVFDDLRLYGHLKAPTDLPPRPIDDIVFEVQIKTFLQHAWSIATHDLVYKFDRVSWARNRVAYQIKALLEHAELSVSTIEDLEKSGSLPSVGSPEAEQQAIINLLTDGWPAEDLPEDKRRLATNIWTLVRNCSLQPSVLGDLLSRGKALYRGEHPRTLSPFQCVLLYLAKFEAVALRELLSGGGSLVGYKIPVADVVLEELGLDRSEAARIH